MTKKLQPAFGAMADGVGMTIGGGAAIRTGLLRSGANGLTDVAKTGQGGLVRQRCAFPIAV